MTTVAETPLEQPGPAILKKMHAVMADISSIKKDKQNKHYKYWYASEEAIKTALHAAFVKHGIVPKFDFFEVQSKEWAPTGAGKAQFLTEVSVGYAFYCTETGECLSGSSVACGIDGEDKGVYKAITQAIKYVLTSAFLIPTGDDAEKTNDYEAEEATGSPKPPPSENPTPNPSRTRAKATAKPPTGGTGRKDARPDNAISDGKVKRYWALFYDAKENRGWTEDDRLMALRRHDYEEAEAIHWKDYEAVCAEFEKMPAGPAMRPPTAGLNGSAEELGITDDDVPF